MILKLTEQGMEILERAKNFLVLLQDGRNISEHKWKITKTEINLEWD